MNYLAILKQIGRFEGVSFLLLLFVCMPLKYMLDMPEPTRFVGMAHGVLFIAYVWLVVMVKANKTTTWFQTAMLLIASVLPFGTFVAESKMINPLLNAEQAGN